MAIDRRYRDYKLLPPDGGWGYAIVASTTLIMMATIVPLGVFGMVFGNFLAQIGDDTSGITLVTSTYNTISFFMGLVANILLKKYTFRKVALLGSVIHFIGCISTIFVTSLEGLIFTFGVLEGIGFGLLLPASYSAFNAYFDNKMAFMMSVSQTIMVVGYMVLPYVGNWAIAEYGDRGTWLLLAALSAFCFPASIALQPVKWHLKKEKIEEEEMEIRKHSIVTISEKDILSTEPFLLNNKFVENNNTDMIYRRRKSSVVLGERVASLASLGAELKEEDKNVSFWDSLVHSMDLHLLADWKYMNITIGLSLSFLGDVAFYPIIPSIMGRIGFSSSEIALMISVYFGADLAARITLSVISAFSPVNSRMLILISSALSACLQIALIFNDSLIYKLIILATLGYIRCFIQTPQALVISDHYPNNFESAYSLYMVVNGAVSLIYGPLMSIVKSVTNSDVWVCQLLTAAFAITVVSWSVEMLACKKKPQNDSNTKT